MMVVKKGNSIYLIDVSKNTRNGLLSDNQRKDIENQLAKIGNMISQLETSKKNDTGYAKKQKLQYT